jgi:hypothetical protein
MEQQFNALEEIKKIDVHRPLNGMNESRISVIV